MAGFGSFLERAGRPAEEIARARREPVHQAVGGARPRRSSHMRLGRLTGLERDKLEAEYKERWLLTDYLEGCLGDESKLIEGDNRRGCRRSRPTFADERRTRSSDAEAESSPRSDRPGRHWS